MTGKLVDTVETILSDAQLAYCLNEAWKLIYKEYPSHNSLAVLWAQVALETGRGKFCKNYNFGNIKRHDDEDYCMFRCNEVIGGKVVWFDPPNPATEFCAYVTDVLGAQEYITFVSQRTRYQAAWKQVIAGNPVAYCAALKAAGYFTADLVQYTKGVVSLCDEFLSKVNTFLEYVPPVPAPEPAPAPVVVPVPEPVPAPVVVVPIPAPVIPPAPVVVEPAPGFTLKTVLDFITNLISTYLIKK